MASAMRTIAAPMAQGWPGACQSHGRGRTNACPPTPDRPQRVLVVDSDAITGHLYADILTQSGYAVVVVQTGWAAVHALTAPHPCPDVVILEYGLPDMPGHAVLDHCRAVCGDLPVLRLRLTTTRRC